MSYIPPTASQVAKMDAAVSQVGNDMLAYQGALTNQSTGKNGTLNTVFTWLGGGQEDAANANANAFSQMQGEISRWQGDDYQAVLNGELSLERWFGTGKAFHQVAQSNVADIGNWSWDGIVSQTATATKEDVNKDVKAASTALVADTWPVLLAVGGILLLVLLVKAS